MATTQADIREWINEASEDTRWMIVVADTFDYEDYPVYVADDEKKFWEAFDAHNEAMQRIMEVYDLDMDVEPQLKEFRANHWPARSLP